MKLIVAGSWLNKSGFFKAKIRKVNFFNSIEEIPKKFPVSFLILSYSLSSETLNVKVKNYNEAPIIFIEIEHFEEYLKENTKPVILEPFGTSMRDEDYLQSIEKVKSYIESGDVYQINLTNEFRFYLEGNSEDLFFNYYKTQPVPYAFFLQIEDFFIVSGSMELFLERKGKKITSKPIKGTGKNPGELIKSEKERAENLMITDMVRNDLGKISIYGSVKVEELFKVEKFKTLYQMHSTVSGITEKSFKEIIKATFPPASVTGAPKKRAVEIIDELEPHARTYYCGAGGILFPNGDFKLSVLIRTAVGEGSKLRYYAGCGIVWDSIPENELKELHLKTKAFLSSSLYRNTVSL